MEILTPLFKSSLDFVRANLIGIIVSIVVIFLLYLVFYITSVSLKKLKIEVFANYPFDRFFPTSPEWSVGYFLITIIVLGLLIFFLIKGQLYGGAGFHLGPA